MSTYEEEEYFRILDPEPLQTIDPKGIVGLLFRKREFFVDIPLYIRTNEPQFFLDKIFVFKLLQPFDCEIIIAANSLSGGNWESLELRGDYESYQKQALEFVKSYIKKRVTKNKELRVEVDSDSFQRVASRISPFNGFVVEEDKSMMDDELDFDFEIEDDEFECNIEMVDGDELDDLEEI